MKKSIVFGTSLFITLLWITFQCSAQTSDWSWARQAGGSGVEHLQAITGDGFGGIWITGTFERTAHFQSDSLIAFQHKDVYLAHLDHLGNWQELIQLEGSGMVYCYDLRKDKNQNIYLSGAFDDQLMVQGQTFLAMDRHDSFIASFNPKGELRWLRQSGGKGTDGAMGLAVHQDRLYALQVFSESAADTIIEARTNQLEIQILDLEGQLTQNLIVEGVGRVLPRKILCDSEGNVYIGGRYSGDLNLGPKQFDPEQSLFVLKLDPEGQVDWLRNFAYSSLKPGLTDLVVHPGGQVYLTGSFEELGSFGRETIASLGRTDIYLASLNSETGRLNWLERSGGRNYDKGMSLEVSDSSVYLTGWFESVGLFGTDSLVRSYGGNNVFVSKYDLDGNFQWVEIPVARGRSYGSALYRDEEGYLFFGGWFEGLINFPSDLLLNDNKPNLFIGKFRVD